VVFGFRLLFVRIFGLLRICTYRICSLSYLFVMLTTLHMHLQLSHIHKQSVKFYCSSRSSRASQSPYQVE